MFNRILLLSNLLLVVIVILFLKQLFFKTNVQKIVEQPAEKVAALKILKECYKSSQRMDCYKDQLSELTRNHPLSFSQTSLQYLQEYDDLARGCHVLAHYMSRVETNKHPENWIQAIRDIGVDTCGGGYLHGILEAHTSTDGSFIITPKVIDEICSVGNLDKRGLCAHMFAHLLLVQNQADVGKNLSDCDKISQSLKYSCYMGTFMEDHQKMTLDEHGIAKQPVIDDRYIAQMISNCNKHTDSILEACWEEMAEMFAKNSQYEQTAVYKGCMSAPTDSAKIECYSKGVVVLSTYPTFNNQEDLLSICNPFEKDPTKMSRCSSNLIAALMHYSAQFVDRGELFCSGIEKSYQNDCFGSLIDGLKVNVSRKEDRQAFCEQLPKAYQSECLN